MKKTALFTLLALACTSAHAHRVWVSTDHTHGGDILKAELGYGEFPHAEPIVADRLHIFSQPMQLISGKKRQNLVQKGEHNYQYQSAKPVAEGSYLVTAEYQPTFWSKNAAGWQKTDMSKMTDASYCE